MLRACLVSLPAAPVVDPSIRGGIGGTETRAWLFARTLAEIPDTEITFVVRNRKPLSCDQYAGVHVRTVIDPLFNLYEQVGMSVERIPRFPWLKFRNWRASLLWQLPWLAFQRAISPRKPEARQPSAFYVDIPANVFCTFGVQTNSARVIASAHAAGKPAVLVLGSDGDLDEQFLGDPETLNPYGDRAGVCRWILESADAIVCQTEEQQRMLRARFGREGVVVSNPIQLDAWDERAQAGTSPVSDSRFVLWIGRAEWIHKRPMECIEIARLVPEVSFVMVMNPRDPAEEAKVRAAAPSNVRILDYVSPDDLPALMTRALTLLNTSSLEGFPNTFLQAGAACVPVVSLVVGEEFLAASGAGVCVHGRQNLAAEAIRRQTHEESERQTMGKRGREWVAAHHDASTQALQLRDILQSAMLRPGASDHNNS